MVDSGKKDKAGRPIYNIQTYHYGFTTAVPLDAGTSEIVCKYITKYITKDLIRIGPTEQGRNPIFQYRFLAGRTCK